MTIRGRSTTSLLIDTDAGSGNTNQTLEQDNLSFRNLVSVILDTVNAEVERNISRIQSIGNQIVRFITLADLVEDLRSIGEDVAQEFIRVRAIAGESAFNLIARHARTFGFIITDNEEGALVVTRTSVEAFARSQPLTLNLRPDQQA